MSETETEQDIPPEEPEPELAPDEQEAEEEAAEEESQPEPEPEPEPEGRVDEDRAKLAGSLDARFKTYQGHVERTLGDEVTDWMMCPLCASGMAPGFVNRHDLGRVPEEVQGNVTMFLGFQREKKYKQHPGTQTCTTCDGERRLETGAKSGDYMVIDCPICKGYGYTPPPGSALPANGTAPDAATVVAENLADLDTPERDNWGEPRVLPDGTLNANYGKMPQFKSVHPTYGVTANLSPEELIAG